MGLVLSVFVSLARARDLLEFSVWIFMLVDTFFRDLANSPLWYFVTNNPQRERIEQISINEFCTLLTTPPPPPPISYFNFKHFMLVELYAIRYTAAIYNKALKIPITLGISEFSLRQIYLTNEIYLGRNDISLRNLFFFS